jgi:hypothetical protein
VGAPPAENRREDVLLVQFIFTVIASAPLPTTDPGVLVAARAVRITGSIDDVTITAIKAQQNSNLKIETPSSTDG